MVVHHVSLAQELVGIHIVVHGQVAMPMSDTIEDQECCIIDFVAMSSSSALFARQRIVAQVVLRAHRRAQDKRRGIKCTQEKTADNFLSNEGDKKDLHALRARVTTRTWRRGRSTNRSCTSCVIAAASSNNNIPRSATAPPAPAQIRSRRLVLSITFNSITFNSNHG